MTKKFNQYVGKAGHLAVMSEFLILGWKVAIPEVDIGDDIFVVHDNNGTLKRIQVKTSVATPRLSGFSAQFSLSLNNLKNITNIPAYYIFIVRNGEDWSQPIVIKQDYLLDFIENSKIGSEHKGKITLYFSYGDSKVDCSGLDFTPYIRDFSDFPLTAH